MAIVRHWTAKWIANAKKAFEKRKIKLNNSNVMVCSLFLCGWDPILSMLANDIQTSNNTVDIHFCILILDWMFSVFYLSHRSRWMPVSTGLMPTKQPMHKSAEHVHMRMSTRIFDASWQTCLRRFWWMCRRMQATHVRLTDHHLLQYTRRLWMPLQGWVYAKQRIAVRVCWHWRVLACGCLVWSKFSLWKPIR